MTFDRVNLLESSASSMDSIEGSKVSSKDYMLNLLKEMEKKSHVPINAYKEIVRFLVNQFNDTPYLNDQLETVLVKCRYGNAERTIASFKDHDNIVLPLMTISQGSVSEANERRRVGSVILEGKHWNDEIQRAERVIALCDRPVTIQYNLNIWCKYMEDMDHLSQAVRLAFNPAIQLLTNFSRDSKAFLDTETNNYSFSVGDREDRILRKTFSITIETYLKNPRYKITSTGKMEEFNLEGYAI